MGLELAVQLLEPLQTLPIVHRGALRQNVDAEVRLVDLLVVLLLIVRRQVSLTLQIGLKKSQQSNVTYECDLQALLLLVEAALDDLGSGQKTLLQVLQCFILHVDGRHLVEDGVGGNAQLFQNRA